MAGVVRIKRVYAPAEPGDGYRVLVDRLWPRGLTKAAAAIDLWAKEAAPTTELRRWYHKDRSQWAEFRRRYLAELRANPGATGDLAARVRAGETVTLLYAAASEEQNHAMVLAERLKAGAKTGGTKKGAKAAKKKARAAPKKAAGRPEMGKKKKKKKKKK